MVELAVVSKVWSVFKMAVVLLLACGCSGTLRPSVFICREDLQSESGLYFWCSYSELSFGFTHAAKVSKMAHFRMTCQTILDPVLFKGFRSRSPMVLTCFFPAAKAAGHGKPSKNTAVVIRPWNY